jgi:hypothetical protein
VSGTGFYAHETVRVLWDLVSTRLIGRAFTTASGTFTIKVTIPRSARPGSHLVQAVGNRSQNTLEQAYTNFIVTG